MIIISKPILLKGIVTEAEIWKAIIILFDFCLAHIWKKDVFILIPIILQFSFYEMKTLWAFRICIVQMAKNKPILITGSSKLTWTKKDPK